ncbi:MAG: hypothetical protein E7253_05460 [Lachnospiraceae bacterium]|nr:hypothetical protein [Lachnospiraceae bacterium]
MNYEEFKQCLSAILKEKYAKEEYEVNIRKIVKNNGLCLDGLCIFHKEEPVSPTIYLDSYYQQYTRGALLADIIDDIEKEYARGMRLKPVLPNVEAYYETVRSQIIMRLVNYDKNKEILEECPYIPFHDLAITFRWLAHQDSIGISTALISNKELEVWGISLEQLYEDAVRNTEQLFPAEINRLRDVMAAKGIISEDTDFDLYLVTNEQGINGATCILYNGLLKEFARVHKSSFYLLPSSIHEMMICFADENISEDMLLSLVRKANHVVVTMGEVLSDNIYYYDYICEELSMIENY